MNIQEHIILAPYTVFKIGGPAHYFFEAKNREEIREAVAWACKQSMPLFVLGAGSNVLVSDEGFDGLVLKINARNVRVEGDMLIADAGASMGQAVSVAMQRGLGGLEWAIGIPGTVGGSVFGNAGCFGAETKDAIAAVDVLQYPEMLCLKNSDCDFSYRTSAFKRHPEWIILGAVYKLSAQDPEDIKRLIAEYSKKRTVTQDIGSKCAGCIFKNAIDPNSGSLISAGYLIDTAGMKGVSVGGAMVSPKHANFIINTGGATAHDVKQLISMIKEKIRSYHGIELHEEMRYL